MCQVEKPLRHPFNRQLQCRAAASVPPVSLLTVSKSAGLKAKGRRRLLSCLSATPSRSCGSCRLRFAAPRLRAAACRWIRGRNDSRRNFLHFISARPQAADLQDGVVRIWKPAVPEIAATQGPNHFTASKRRSYGNSAACASSGIYNSCVRSTKKTSLPRCIAGSEHLCCSFARLIGHLDHVQAMLVAHYMHDCSPKYNHPSTPVFGYARCTVVPGSGLGTRW